MGTKKVRSTLDVTGDVETEALLKRYRELRGYVQTAETEKEQISEKLKGRMRESGADEMKDGFTQVARMDLVAKESFDLKAFKLAHPRLYRRFATTGDTTERISVP